MLKNTNDLKVSVFIDAQNMNALQAAETAAKAVRGGADRLLLYTGDTDSDGRKFNEVKTVADRFATELIINEAERTVKDGTVIDIRDVCEDEIEAYVRSKKAWINDNIFNTPVYKKEDLINDLKNAGLTPDSAVMVHSSMKAIGKVEGGADTVVDAFMEYFADGLLMMPEHTWKQMSEQYNVFDSETEPSCVGIITNIFRKREGVYRSLHPTHSIAAYGKNVKGGVNAEEYVKNDDEYDTPCNPNGCFGRIRQQHGYILLVGVTHARNTYIHSIEESIDVPERFTDKPVIFKVKKDKELKEVRMYRHYNVNAPHISEHFDKLMQGYYYTGAAKKVKFGDAECILCDADKLYKVTEQILKNNVNAFLDEEIIPESWYKGLKVI